MWPCSLMDQICLSYFGRRPFSDNFYQIGGFRLFPQATLLIRQRFMCASFLTDLYLECGYKCGYEDLLHIRNKTNMPEEKQIRISSTFFLSCKQETKYNISDITL